MLSNLEIIGWEKLWGQYEEFFFNLIISNLDKHVVLLPISYMASKNRWTWQIFDSLKLQTQFRVVVPQRFALILDNAHSFVLVFPQMRLSIVLLRDPTFCLLVCFFSSDSCVILGGDANWPFRTFSGETKNGTRWGQKHASTERAIGKVRWLA